MAFVAVNSSNKPAAACSYDVVAVARY